jgi:hypothetical protein
MKIGEYKQMMKYITRPGTPEQNKKADENNKKYLADRKAKTVKEYGLENHVVDTLNKFEDGPNIPQPKKIETKPTNKDGGPDILRNILIEEMKTRDLDSDEIRYLMDTKDRSSLNSQKFSNTEQRILAKENKPNTKATPKQATPEQYGKLAERLERQRQMTGTKSKPLKPFIKKPKQLELPLDLPKIDPNLIESLSRVPDPETARLEKRFNEILQQKKDEDLRIATSGLAALIGDKKND